jgi:hypothetical protein
MLLSFVVPHMPCPLAKMSGGNSVNGVLVLLSCISTGEGLMCYESLLSDVKSEDFVVIIGINL